MFVLLIIALALQTPAAPSGAPRKQNPEPAHKAEHGASPSPKVTPSVIPSATPYSTPRPADEKNGHKQDADTEPYRVDITHQPFDVLMLLYVIITSLAAFLALGTLIQIKKQVREMKKARLQGIRQIRLMRELNAINRETLHAVYRAYVRFPFEIESTRLESEETNEEIPKTWRFWIPLLNDGQTPTKGLRFQVNWAIWEGDLPKDFSYPNHGRADEHPRELPPKGKHLSGTIDFSHAQIRSIANKEKRLFFYGWAAYNDVFKGTMPHTTIFCHEITWIRFKDRGFEYGIQVYGPHNSSD